MTKDALPSHFGARRVATRGRVAALAVVALATIATGSIQAQALVTTGSGGGSTQPAGLPPVPLTPQFPTPKALPASASTALPPVGAALSQPATPVPASLPVDSWTPFVHTHRNANGTVSADMHVDPTYRPSGTTWTAVNPVLGVTTDPQLPFAAPGSLWPIRFGTSNADLFELQLGSGPIVASAPGLAVGVPVHWNNGVLYAGVATATDLRYTVSSTGVKEEIVLNSAQAPTSFTLHLSDPEHQLGTVARAADGGFVFSTVFDGAVRLEVPPAFAYEPSAPGAPPLHDPSSAHLAVVPAGDGFDVSVSVDATWLQGKSFPLILDPSLNFTDAYGTYGLGAYVANGCGGCYSLTTQNAPMGMGSFNYPGSNDDEPIRTFYDWNLTGTIPLDSQITAASFNGYVVGCFEDKAADYHCNSNTYYEEIHALTHSWNTSYSWNQLNGYTDPAAFVGINQSPFCISYVAGGCNYNPGGCTTCFWQSFNMQTTVQDWVDNPPSNYGFVAMLHEPVPYSIGGPVWDFEQTDTPQSGGHPYLAVTWNPAPSAPGSASATAGDKQASVSWTAANPNGGTLDHYVVQAYTSGGYSGISTNACASCSSTTVSGLNDGTAYYFNVGACDTDGVCGPTVSTNWVTPEPTPVITKTILNAQSFYTVGQSLTYQLTVNNPGTVAVGVSSVTDTLPVGVSAPSSSGLPGTGNVVLLDGGVCPTTGSMTCALTGSRFSATGTNFQLGPNSTLSLTFPAVVTGAVDRSCSQVSNVASLVTSVGNSTSNTVPITVCDVGLGYENWWSYVNQDLGGGGKTSVNVANGNLVAQYTDSTPVQAHGRFAYVLRRSYNSEDTSNWVAASGQSVPGLTVPATAPIGAGWRLNVDEVGNGVTDGVSPSALEVPTVQSVLDSGFDVTLVDEDGTRHVFTPNAITANARLNVTPSIGIPQTSDLFPLVSRVINTLTGGYAALCVDETFTSPEGVHLSLWRYVEVAGSCASPAASPAPLSVGFAAMRPDRVRYEFSLDGHLLDVIDGAGTELRYSYANQPVNLPVTVALGNLQSVDEPRSCGGTMGSSTCRALTFSYPSSTETDVTDPGGRTTQYLLNASGQLVQVKNEQAGSAYTYAYSAAGCGSSGSTSGQLCAASDLNGSTTHVTYGTAANGLGLQRVASITDRVGNTTTFNYSTGTSSVPCGTTGATTTDFLTADRGGEEQRFTCFDSSGSAGELDAGGPGGNAYLHRTLSFWDEPNGTHCIQGQATAAPDHDLCRRFTFTNDASLPAPTGQYQGLGPSVPWSYSGDTSYAYNPEGQVLASDACLTATDPASTALPAACGQAADTTDGYSAGYVMGDQTLVSSISDQPTGNGGVTSTTRPNPATHGGVLYALSDQTESLTPNGNAAGSLYGGYLTHYAHDANYSVNPNAVVGVSAATTPSFCSASNTSTNSGLLCSQATPAGTTAYTYDTYGQRLTMTTPNGGAHSYTYYADTATDLTGHTQAAGWLKAVTDPAGNFIAYAYDQGGNRVRTWDRNATQGDTVAQFPGTEGAPTNAQYSETDYGAGSDVFASPWRYVVAKRDALGNTTTYTRDGNGNQLTMTDPLSHVTTQTFDHNDELLSTLKPAEANYHGSGKNDPTTYAYDAFGNNTVITNPAAVATVFTYDTVNRLTTTSFTLSAWPANTATVPSACRESTSSDAPLAVNHILCTSSTTYDGLDNKVGVSDGNGQPTYTHFDGLRHVVKTVGPRQAGGAGTTTMHLYDADGNTLWTCSPREFTEGSNNCLNDTVSAATGHQDYSTAYGYDSSDRQLTTTTFRQVAPGSATFQSDPASQTYDADGNVLSQTDGNGHTTTYTYDTLDRKSSMTVPRDATTTETTSWTYDPSGNTVSETLPGASAQGQSAANHITVYTYDADNRVIDTVTGADSSNPSADALPDGAGTSNIRTRNVYDANGNVVAAYAPGAFATSVSSPDTSYVTNYTYDADDRQTVQLIPFRDQGAHSDPATASQDNQCPVTAPPLYQRTIVLPDGGYAQVTVPNPSDVAVCALAVDYDPAGNRLDLYTPAYTSGMDGNEYLRYAYTDDNHVASVDSPSPSTTGGRVRTAYAYDAVGNQELVTDPLGDSQGSTFTPDNLVASTTDALGKVTTLAHDASGNQTLTTDPMGVQTATRWYSDNHREFLTAAAQDISGDQYTGTIKNTTAYGYDKAGNPTRVFSPAAWASSTGSSLADPSNTGGIPTTNTYTYDNLVASTVEPAVNGGPYRETDYTYDGSGLKLSEHVYLASSPGAEITGDDGGIQSFAYYPDSRLSAQNGRTGGTISTAYDPAGDQVHVSDSSGGASTLTGTYYLNGLARTVTNGAATTEYSYDGQGQISLRGEVSPTGATPTTETTYFYNSAELPYYSSESGSVLTQRMSYDAAGRPLSEALNGASLTASYNANDTLATQNLAGASGGTIANWSYVYDSADRITSQQFSGTSNYAQTICYSYDPAGRVSTGYTAAAQQSCGTPPAVNITYDHNGNRLTYSGALASAPDTFTYNPDNSIRTENGRSYTYAVFGGVSSDGCSTYNYDGFDRLSAATATPGASCAAATTTAYTYDALDRVASSKQGSLSQTFDYDGWGAKALSVVQGSGSQINYELSSGGQPLAVLKGLVGTSATTTQSLVDDGQGNIVTAIDTGGGLSCSARFDAFGNPLDPANTTSGTLNPCNWGSTPNTYFYRGAMQDQTTGDYGMGSRLYDPKKDSFLTPDTYRTGSPAANPSVGIDPLTANTYSYVNGDPVNLVDPNGHAACADNSNCLTPQASAAQITAVGSAAANARPSSGGNWVAPYTPFAHLAGCPGGCASISLLYADPTNLLNSRTMGSSVDYRHTFRYDAALGQYVCVDCDGSEIAFNNSQFVNMSNPGAAAGLLLTSSVPTTGNALDQATRNAHQFLATAYAASVGITVVPPLKTAGRSFYDSNGNPDVSGPGISLDQARAAAERNGIDMSCVDLCYEPPTAPNYINAYGSSRFNGDDTPYINSSGRFEITLQDPALASEQDAVETIAHELAHLQAVGPNDEIGAEEAAQVAGENFVP